MTLGLFLILRFLVLFKFEPPKLISAEDSSRLVPSISGAYSSKSNTAKGYEAYLELLLAGLSGLALFNLTDSSTSSSKGG